MALCMAFSSETELNQWTVSEKIVNHDVLERYPEMCPRHMACRYYLSLAIVILDTLGGCTIDAVYCELLCVIAAFNMGALATCRNRFAILLSRAVSMGLHKDPITLLTEPYSSAERKVRAALAFQIQHIDFIVSSCLGSQPISFDLFCINTTPEGLAELPDFCRFLVEAVQWAKKIYATFFPSSHGISGGQTFQKATEITVFCPPLVSF
jgi:hypothetical protein